MPVSTRLTASKLVKTSFAFALTAIAFSNTPLLEAASLYWDGDATAAGNDSLAGTGLGGTGNWNNSLSGTPLANWWNGAATTDQTWVNANNDTAIFSGTAGTVTLTDNITAGGLLFSTTGYTLNNGANTLTFASGSTITANNVAAATITGAVAGSGPVTITRSTTATTAGSALGTINFNGTSAGGWSGATAISNGATASLSAGNQALLNTSSIALAGGITLTNTSAQASLNRVSDTAAITSNGGTITYANTSTASTAYAETIGSVGLTSGALNVVLSNNQNASSNTQALTLAGLTRTGTSNTSTVAFSAATTGPNATTNRINVVGATATTAGQIIGPWASVGTAAATQTDYAVYDSAGNIVAANIAASGESTWTTPANAYTVTGGSALTATRTITALRATGGAQAIDLAGFNLETNGILNAGSGTLTISGAGNVRQQGTAAGSVYINTGSTGGAITISSIIANNTGALTLVKTGAGTLSVTGANTYTGDTVVQEGTFLPSASVTVGGNIFVGSLGGGPAAVYGVSTVNTAFKSGATATVYSNGTFYFLNNGSTMLTTLNIIGGTASSGFGFVSGAINMTGGTLTGVNLSGGTVFNTNASASTALVNTTMGSYYGGYTFTVAEGAAAIDLNVTGKINTGTSAGAAGMTKSGAGLMQVVALNTYTGTTTINGGTLRAGIATTTNNGAFGNNGAMVLANTAGVILDLNGFNTTIGSLAGGGVTGGNVTLGSATITTGGNNTSTSFSGIISGTGGLTKVGTGTQTLTRASTYTGATTVSDGVLSLGVANAITASSGVVLSGGTIQSGFAQTLGALNLSASSTINLTAGGSFAFADSSALAWTGTLSITGTFSDNASIRFGTDANGLTSDQLSQILINGGAASLNSSGYLVGSAIPEPSTYAAIFGALALAGTAWKRRSVRAARAARA